MRSTVHVSAVCISAICITTVSAVVAISTIVAIASVAVAIAVAEVPSLPAVGVVVLVGGEAGAGAGAQATQAAVEAAPGAEAAAEGGRHLGSAVLAGARRVARRGRRLAAGLHGARGRGRRDLSRRLLLLLRRRHPARSVLPRSPPTAEFARAVGQVVDGDGLLLPGVQHCVVDQVRGPVALLRLRRRRLQREAPRWLRRRRVHRSRSRGKIPRLSATTSAILFVRF